MCEQFDPMIHSEKDYGTYTVKRYQYNTGVPYGLLNTPSGDLLLIDDLDALIALLESGQPGTLQTNDCGDQISVWNDGDALRVEASDCTRLRETWHTIQAGPLEIAQAFRDLAEGI